jgi:tetratricopeptide (TPR) repeat protein
MSGRYLDSSLAEYTSIFGRESNEALTASTDLCQSLMMRGEAARAESLLRQNIPRLEREFQNGNLPSERAAVALNDLAVVLRWRGNPKEAEALVREGIQLRPFTVEQGAFVLTVMQGNLAAAISEQGRTEEAIALLRNICEERQKETSLETPELGFIFSLLGFQINLLNNSDEADSFLVRAERIYQKFHSPTHLRIADGLLAQAMFLFERKRFEEAEINIDDALRIYQFNMGTTYYNYPTALGVRGLILNYTGRGDEAEQTLREAVALRAAAGLDSTWLGAVAIGELGECLTTHKRFAEAGE